MQLLFQNITKNCMSALVHDLSEKADMEHLVKKVQEQFSFGSNRRGSADYRRHIAGVLVKRACAANEQQEDRK